MEFDKNKFVYFGTIKNPEFYDRVIPILKKQGVSEKQIIKESASKFAQNDDYIVQPWFPDEPTELIIGRIKKGETIEPKRMGDGQLDLVQYDEIMRIPFS